MLYKPKVGGNTVLNVSKNIIKATRQAQTRDDADYWLI